MIRASILVTLLAISLSAFAGSRDQQQVRAFRRDNPCPSTQQAKGRCLGYNVDHKKALMNGGKDRPQNMQWLSENEHREKTKKDYAQCKDSYTCKNKRVAKRAPWAKPKKAKHKKKAVTE